MGRKLYTIHRLDRAAAGLLVFAGSSESASYLGALFRDHAIAKTYHILVRGWMKEAVCNKPLKYQDSLKTRDAETRFIPERYYRLPLAFGQYPEVRLTWCRVEPGSGRRHQIRLHAKSLAHPVIGDIKHGDIKLSRFLEAPLGASRLWLVCTGLAFVHPRTQKPYDFQIKPDHEILEGLAAIEPYRLEPDESEKT